MDLAVVVQGQIPAHDGHGDIGSTAACCAIVAVPVVSWYLALNNHSQIHPQLVYRSLPIAFGAVASLVYAASRGPVSQTTGSIEGPSDVFVAGGLILDENHGDKTAPPASA